MWFKKKKDEPEPVIEVDVNQPPPVQKVAWIEANGSLVISDGLLREINISQLPERPGYVLDRDASIRAYRYVPNSLAEDRAFEKVIEELEAGRRIHSARTGINA